MSIKLKNKYDFSSVDKLREVEKSALICELGFYIGTNKTIDDYIKKNIISEINFKTDEFVVFYLFCKFVVEKFFDSDMQDIYYLIEYNYVRLVGMFKNEYCEEENNDYNILLCSGSRVIGLMEVKNGLGADKMYNLIYGIIYHYFNCGKYNDKESVYEDYNGMLESLEKEIQCKIEKGNVVFHLLNGENCVMYDKELSEEVYGSKYIDLADIIDEIF